MKKKFLIILIMIFVIAVFCQADNNINTLDDFAEKNEIRRILNTNRNYAYPKILKIKEEFIETYISDMSNPIYIAYSVMANLEKKFVSQELFSEIVECLTTYPKEFYDGYYSKIYIAEILSVSNIISFAKDKNKLTIDIYDNEGKESLIVTINPIDNYHKQVFYKIESSVYDNELFPKEFIEAAWYAMWNFQWKEAPTNFVLNNNISKIYSVISTELSKKSWNDFCNNYESIVFLEEIFEKLYYKPNYLERMIFTELIQRCIIAAM